MNQFTTTVAEVVGKIALRLRGFALGHETGNSSFCPQSARLIGAVAVAAGLLGLVAYLAYWGVCLLVKLIEFLVEGVIRLLEQGLVELGHLICYFVLGVIALSLVGCGQHMLALARSIGGQSRSAQTAVYVGGTALVGLMLSLVLPYLIAAAIFTFIVVACFKFKR